MSWACWCGRAAPRRRRRRSARKVAVVEDLKALLKLKPDVVVEAASQQAVRDWGETILKKGFDLMVIATGAYGDPKLWKKHVDAAGQERRAAAPAVGRDRRPRRPAGDAARQARAGEIHLDQAAACLVRHAGRDRVRPAVDQGADGDLPRHAGRCRPALSEERQPRGDGGAVRRRARSAPTSSWWPIPTLPPGTNASRLEVVSDSGELKTGAAGLVDAGQSQDRRADRAHHGRRPDEDGARQRLVRRYERVHAPRPSPPTKLGEGRGTRCEARGG